MSIGVWHILDLVDKYGEDAVCKFISDFSTKKKLERKTPEEVAAIVTAAIDEINHGSITPLDELINSRL